MISIRNIWLEELVFIFLVHLIYFVNKVPKAGNYIILTQSDDLVSLAAVA